MNERFDGPEGKKTFATIATPQDISLYRVWSLLIGAFEGGSNHWAAIKDVKAPGLVKGTDYAYTHELPLIEGCEVTLEDSTGLCADEGESWVLNRETLKRGLEVMAAKYPRHWQDFVSENDDAETADVFLQCAALGEIVFG